ncbi:MAG: glycosyltransferase [Myxococcales bacterium]|nr:glycosyltransferase [Myxococcales bacterium]
MSPAVWQELALAVVTAADDAILVYFLVLNSLVLCLVVLGFLRTRRVTAMVHTRDLRSRMQSPLMSPVSVIVPAYNEAANIVETAHSLLQLRYPRFEVLIVNDGSDDETLERLVERFALYPVGRGFEQRVPCQKIRAIYESRRHPNLVVVDKENGGKGDALNAGLNVSRYPLFCGIDGDSVLEADALLRVVRPFHEHPDTMVAAGGTVRIANGSLLRAGRVVDVGLARGVLPRVQVVEYLRAFLFGRMGWASLGGLLIISGAFGVFQRRAVIEAGGYATDSVGEDMELVVRLHRSLRDRGQRYRIGFVPEPVCWTEAPASLAVLRRQRTRWQRGLIDSFSRHRQMLCNPRYGTVGLLAMPYYFLFELLGPLVELSGYVVVPLSYMLGILDLSVLQAFFAAAVLYAVVISIVAMLLDDLAFRRYRGIGQLLSLASAAVVEAVAFRPLCAWWRSLAFWHHARKDMSWGRMDREGLAAPALGSDGRGG